MTIAREFGCQPPPCHFFSISFVCLCVLFAVLPPSEDGGDLLSVGVEDFLQIDGSCAQKSYHCSLRQKKPVSHQGVTSRVPEGVA